MSEPTSTLVSKMLIFRRPCEEPWSVLLREVADYLDSASDAEPLIHSIICQEYVSEPTRESSPDCEQQHEVIVTVLVPALLNDVRVKDLRT